MRKKANITRAQHEKRTIPCISEDVALNLRHVFVLWVVVITDI